jgi:hypothetical protein
MGHSFVLKYLPLRLDARNKIFNTIKVLGSVQQWPSRFPLLDLFICYVAELKDKKYVFK